MSLHRSWFLSLPLSIFAVSCGPPPEANPPAGGGTPPPASATATPTAAPTAEPAASPASSHGKTIAVSGGTVCAVVSGRVACWGDNSKGAIAAGPKGAVLTPVWMAGVEQVTSVDVSRVFGCAVAVSGKIVCFHEGKAREIPLVTDASAIAIRETKLFVVRKSGALIALDLGYDASETRPSEVPELKDVVSVGTGYNHACALHKNGEVTCWGDVEMTGSGVDTAEMEWEEKEKLSKNPTKVKGLTDAVQLSVADTHTCAVRRNKQVACWGSNWSGELGDGSNDRRYAPVGVQLVEDAAEVAVGYHHTCIRRASGKALCFGEGRSGQTGSGKPGARGLVEVAGLSGITALGAGEEVTCAASGNNIQCWGSASRGRLGNGTTSDYTTPTLVKGATGAKMVGATDSLSCVMDGAGKLACWGLPGFPEDMAGKRADSPRPITNVGEPDALFMKDSGICVVNKAKKVYCEGSYSFVKEPKELNVGAVKQIWTSGSSGSAIQPSGQVMLWQRDWEKPDNVLKQNLTGLNDAVGISGESGTVCAVRRSGKVGCVGYGFRTFDKKEPVKPAAAVEIPGITDAVSISGSGGELCVVRKSGEVSCFSTYRVPQPVDPRKPAADKKEKQPIEVRTVKGVANAASVHIGGGARCVLHKDATVSCWGQNSYGQLGTGDFEYRWDPAVVAGLTDVTSLAVGSQQVCAAKKTGEVYCWGRNTHDEVGQPAPAYAYAPVTVNLPK